MKRVALVFLLCVVVVCGTVFAGGNRQEAQDLTLEKDEEIARLTRQIADLETKLSDQFIEATRTPLTPQIVKQIREDNKERLFGEIQYYTSVDITLIRDVTQGSSIELTTPSSILQFTESSSWEERRIFHLTAGRLVSVSSGYDVFEIGFPSAQITLGFVFNTDRNWYDLQYAIDAAENGHIPLIMAGAHPHLMTNYRTEFSPVETRIQMQPPATQPPQPSSTSPRSLAPEPSPRDSVVPPVWEEAPAELAAAPAEEWEVYYPEEDYYLEDDYYVENNGYYLDDYYENEYFVDLPVDEEVPVLVPAEPRPPQEITVILPGSGTAVAEGPQEAPRQQETYQAANTLFTGNFFVLQIGAFQDKKHADAAYAALEREGFSPGYENYQDLTRVIIPAVASKDLARTRERVKALGFGEPYIRQ
jgi:cell division septation protein DedD